VNKAEEIALSHGRMLPLMEAFYSIQGEGAQTGKAAYFMRIGGCDVGCYWCDVKESWNPDIHPLTETDKIIEDCLASKADSVVVTGGEPLLYNMNYLTKGLKEQGIKTFLETSGSSPLSGFWDWICLSPKKAKPPEKLLFSLADELKIIIHDDDDFMWAEENASLLTKDSLLFLQPEWSRSKEMMPVIVEYILQHPKWRMSLQSHKYMGVP